MESKDSKLYQKKWKNSQISLWVVVSLLLAVVLIIVVLILVAYFCFIVPLVEAFGNNNICTTNPQYCQWYDLKAPIPLIFPLDKFDYVLAYFCAQLVFNTEDYSKNDNNLYLPESFQLIGELNTNEKDASPFGFVALDSSRKTLYISFRGSLTLREWYYDFCWRQKSLFPQTLNLSLHEENNILPINNPCSSNALVHGGMFEIFQEIQPALRDYIIKTINDFERVVLCGHSLGGACADYSAVYLKTTLIPKRNVLVYTFGKPRPGNVAYSACVQNLLGKNYWCITNTDDLIPFSPFPASPNFSDPKQPFIYEQDGNAVYYSLNWGSLSSNHSMNNYAIGTQQLHTQ